jgi:pyruvate dehydrogenase E2 component (dihydrolipoamide acetyltransferase)
VAERIVLTVPDIGDFSDVEVIDLLVAPGDEVEIDAPLVTLETDKATMDIPSTAAGRVVELKVERGARVSKGDALAVLESAASDNAADAGGPGATDDATDDATEEAAEDRPSTAEQPTESPAAAKAPAAAASQPMARVVAPAGAVPPVEEAGFARAHASPSVRRFARELGVDLGRVKGSGAKGRITQDDVKGYVKSTLSGSGAAAGGGALPRVPEVDFAAFGPVEVKPLSRVQRISGPRLHASWVNVPHVTQHDLADITELEALRGELKEQAAASGIKLTPLAFILRACARVLADFPRFNASLDASASNLVFKQYLHIGFAADTPNGLVVPVIRDADRKDVYEIARELATLSEKARAGRLAATEMQGGCFTISSLGGIGGTGFTPIINAPEVAILGVSKAQLQPVWREGEFVPRMMLPLSLSYDHRVIDGAEAVRFTVALANALAAPRGLAEAVP